MQSGARARRPTGRQLRIHWKQTTRTSRLRTPISYPARVTPQNSQPKRRRSPRLHHRRVALPGHGRPEHLPEGPPKQKGRGSPALVFSSPRGRRLAAFGSSPEPAQPAPSRGEPSCPGPPEPNRRQRPTGLRRKTSPTLLTGRVGGRPMRRSRPVPLLRVQHGSGRSNTQPRRELMWTLCALCWYARNARRTARGGNACQPSSFSTRRAIAIRCTSLGPS
jgi:hypothetical protein